MKTFIFVLHNIGHICFLVCFNVICSYLNIQGLLSTIGILFSSDFIIATTMLVVLGCCFRSKSKQIMPNKESQNEPKLITI
jgi:hypothetical protein